MADKTIGELENDRPTVYNDKFIFETAAGVTKRTDWVNILGTTFINSAAPGDSIAFFNNSNGTYTRMTYNNFVDLLFLQTLTAGNGITVTSTTDSQTGQLRPVISSTATGGGSVWYFGGTAPQNAESGDYWLHTDTQNYGDVDEYDGSVWNNVGSFAGRDGDDGITPTIDSTTKHWLIGETDTGVIAEGQNGNNGQDGTAATIQVGTVTTGAAGTNASVTNSGTSNAAVFDFVIPRGADGSGSSYTAGDGIDITNNEISVKIGDGLEINQATGNIDVTGGGSSDITRSNLLTLLSANWNNNTQKVSCYLNLTKRNIVDPTLSELPNWISAKVLPVLEEANGITFQCTNIPSNDLTFTVTSMPINSSQESIGYSTTNLVRYLPLNGDLIDRISGAVISASTNTITFEQDNTLNKTVCNINNKYLIWDINSPLYEGDVTNFTFMCLFKSLTSTNLYPTILTTGSFTANGIAAYLYTAHEIRIGWNGSGISGTGVYNDNTWHQLVVTFDGVNNQIIAYIDGTQNIVVSRTFSKDLRYGTLGIIPGSGFGNDYRFNGYACNFAIYDKVLTAAEVANNWQVDVDRYGLGE